MVKAKVNIGTPAAPNWVPIDSGDFTTHVNYAVTTGSANTYAVTFTPAPTAYVDGMAVAVKIHAANTGVSTLNVNGLGAKLIKKGNGVDIAAGQFVLETIVTLRYSSTSASGAGAFLLQGEGAFGNATASDLLSGKTASTDVGQITGTMVNNGAGGTVTPGTSNQTKAAGYYSSAITITGDADLTAANIKSGVNIFGVVGTLQPPTDSLTVSLVVETGYSISQSQLIMLNGSGKAVPYTGSSIGTIPYGMSQTAGTVAAGGTITVAIKGIGTTAGLATGMYYYANTTNGYIDNTIGGSNYLVGFAISTTELCMNM